MQVETRIRNGKTTTFIVPDYAREGEEIRDIAPDDVKLEAVVLQPEGYMFPCLKIVYEGVIQ